MRDETFADTAAYVNAEAPKSFAQHVLTQRSTWSWKVAQPGSWFYGYYLIVAPGAVIIYGDIGEAIFRMNAGSEADVLEWVRRCSNDHDYVRSKLANRAAYRQFYPGDALAYATSTNDTPFLDDVQALAADGLTAESYYHCCWDHNQYDIPSCENWAASAFWFSHAVARFAALVTTDVSA